MCSWPKRRTRYRLRVAGSGSRSFRGSCVPTAWRLGYRATLTNPEYNLLASEHSSLRKSAAVARAALRAARIRREGDTLLLVHRLRLIAPLPGFDPPDGLDVYDFDDALFLASPGIVNRQFGWAKREASRCTEYVRRAKLTLAGNAFLAGYARQWLRTSRWYRSALTLNYSQCMYTGTST